MLGLLKYFATKDVEEAAEKRAIFLSQFNHPSAQSADDPELISAVQGAVKDQLQFPDTADFHQIFVRQCDDRAVRGAGLVTFSGLNGIVSTCGYMVEFTSDDKCELLELHSNFDPVILKTLPPSEDWDGKSISYARPAMRAPLAKSKPDWPFRLKLCAIGLIIAGVVYAFYH